MKARNENNHTCQICGKGYYACDKCEKLNSYKIVVDTPACYGVYLVLTELRQGVIDQTEAQKKLKEQGLTLTVLKQSKTEYIPDVFNKLAEILRGKK